LYIKPIEYKNQRPTHLDSIHDQWHYFSFGKICIILRSQHTRGINTMTKETKNNKVETEKVEINEKNSSESSEKNAEIFSRVFYTILLAIIGWVALWVFAFVVVIQFGFLLITGQVNTNLKGFNKEVGLFLFDIIKYLSFQSNVKPFPFRDWPYDESADNKNKTELNDSEVVKASK